MSDTSIQLTFGVPVSRRSVENPSAATFGTFVHATRMLVTWFIVAVASLVNEPVAVTAAEPAGPLPPVPKFRRVDVPADRPADWPFDVRQFQAVPRDAFLKAVTAANRQLVDEPTAQIESVEYTATAVQETLRSGHFRATVRRAGNSPTLLALEPCNLAFHEIAWTDRPAIYGTGPDGKLWLLVDRAQDTLIGSWSLRGRAMANDVDFDARLLPATVSTIRLRVPRDRQPRWTSPGLGAGSVTLRPRPLTGQDMFTGDEPAGGSLGDWNYYDVHVGAESRCRLTISGERTAAIVPPIVLYEIDSSFVVRADDVRFQAMLQLDVLQAPIQDLVIPLAPGSEIFSVTQGSEISLKWSREGDANHAQLRIAPPEELIGRTRGPIRIDGAMPHRANQSLPQLAPLGGVFVSGRQSVSVARPLQIRSLRGNGYRQLSPSTLVGEYESYVFSQLLADASLILDVRRSSPTITATVLALAESDDDEWRLVADLQLTSVGGSTFQTSFRLPKEWEVTDVQGVAGERVTGLANWDVIPSTTFLTVNVEFLEAIAPGTPRIARLLARRRAPPGGTSGTAEVPVPWPTNCEAVESLLTINGSTRGIPVAETDPRIETVPFEGLNETWRSLPLWTEIAAINRRNALLLRSTTLSPANSGQEPSGVPIARVRFESSIPPINCRATTVIFANRDRLEQRFLIQRESGPESIDRLRVYLTEAGAEVQWRAMLGELTAPVSATRLPSSAHAELGLPRGGELWDLKFTVPTPRAIEILGRRSLAWTTEHSLPLLFVPQSRQTGGQLLIASTTGEAIEAVARGPRESTLELPPWPADLDLLPSEVKQWTYREPGESVLLRRAHDEGIPHRLRLGMTSYLSAEQDGRDVHRAEFGLDDLDGPRAFNVTIEAPARLLAVRVNQQAISLPTQLADGALSIPITPERGRARVELLYDLPSRSGTLVSPRRAVMPHPAAPDFVTEFTWDLLLPPELRLAMPPSELHLASDLPSAKWTERLFGPLGRPRSESVFQPWRWTAWQELFVHVFGPPPKSPLGSPVTQVGSVPNGWQQYRAIGTTLPEQVTLVCWRRDRLFAMSWTLLCSSGLIGIILRKWRWSHRDRVAAYWVATAFVLAALSPSPWAEMAGAGLAGGLLALLLPRRWIDGPLVSKGPGFVDRDSVSAPPSRSGLSFTAGLILAGTTGGIGALGLNLLDPSALASAAEPTIAATNVGETVATVLVPIDADLQPSRAMPVVYVPSGFWENLQAAAAARAPQRITTLIAEADYAIQLSAEEALSWDAKFTVHLLPSDPALAETSGSNKVVLGSPSGGSPRTNSSTSSATDATTIPLWLELSQLQLRGADACRVNGVPCPVTVVTQGPRPGILLQLHPDRLRRGVPNPANREGFESTQRSGAGADAVAATNPETTDRPMEEGTETKSSPATTLPGTVTPSTSPLETTLERQARPAVDVLTITVELALRQPGGRSAREGMFEAGIPRVADAQLTMQFPERTPMVQIPEALGELKQSANQRVVSANLGRISQVRTRWSETRLESPPAEVDLQTVQLMELYPSRSELQVNLKGTVRPDSPPIYVLECQVPEGGIVRSVQAESLLRHEQQKVTTGPSRLVLHFAEPRKPEWSIQVDLVFPVAPTSAVLPLKQLKVLSTSRVKVTERSLLVGFLTTPDYQLELTGVGDSRWVPLPPENWQAAGGEALTSLRPQYAFQVADDAQVGTALSVVPPRRRVTRWQQTARIGKRRLEWVLNAELETLQGSVFSHSLLVDRRLQIESLSVVENGAERLLRLSETRLNETHNRLTVFLTDKTAGTQQLTLRGSQSIQLDQPWTLPNLRFEDADAVTGGLAIYHDSDLTVDLVQTRGLLPLDRGDDNPREIDSRRLLARFEADVDSRATVKTTARAAEYRARCVARVELPEATDGRVHWLMHLAGEAGIAHDLTILWPSSVRIDQEATTLPAGATWETRPDGRRLLRIPKPADLEEELSCVVVVGLPPSVPPGQDWTLPAPEFVDADQVERWLALPGSRWQPAMPRASEPGRLPDWAKKPRLPGDEESLVVRSDDGPLVIRRRPITAAAMAITVPLVDHQVWADATVLRGTSAFWTTSLSLGLRFRIPEGTTVTGLFVGDSAHSRLEEPGSTVELPPRAGSGPARVTIVWTRPRTYSWWTGGFETVALPDLAEDLPVGQALLTLRTSPEVGVARWRNLRPVTLLDRLMDHLTVALRMELSEPLGSDSLGVPSRLRQALLYERAVRILDQSQKRQSIVTDVQRERWRTLVNELEHRDPLPLDDPLDFDILDEELFVEGTDVRSFELRNTALPFVVWWSWQHRIVGTLLSLLLILGLIPIFRRVIRTEWSPWLAQHANASWMLMGLLWWIALTPSPIGPLLMLLAGLRSLFRRWPLFASAEHR